MKTFVAKIGKEWYAFAACNHQGEPWAYNIGIESRYARSAVKATAPNVERICRPSRDKNLAIKKAQRAGKMHGWKYFGEVSLDGAETLS